MTIADLFDDLPAETTQQPIAPGAVLLRGFALDMASALLQAAEQVIAAAPLRHLVTPGGRAAPNLALWPAGSPTIFPLSDKFHTKSQN